MPIEALRVSFVLLVRTRFVEAHGCAPLLVAPPQIPTLAHDGVYSAGPDLSSYGRLKGIELLERRTRLSPFQDSEIDEE